MIQALTNSWWLFLLRGLAAIAVAVLAFAAPAATLQAVVFVLGFYIFLAGCFAFAAAMSGVAGDRWWAALLEGLVGIAVAFVIWFMPQGSTEVFVYLFAGWAIVTGVLEIAGGIQFRDLLGAGEWLYIISGIVSVAFGVWVVRSPSQGALAEIYAIGFYSAFYGVAQVAFSMRLRSLMSTVKAVAG
ncbi:MAG TPA: DUF308 domain-containing protein [Candidatus Baltobacteraceae bacterium]|jgi:uncharacterized membrane protein HdeD (DUF308 family)